MQRAGLAESWAGGYNHMAIVAFGPQEVFGLAFIKISIINI